MPSGEEIQRELAAVENLDDFFGKNGMFARLFVETLTPMMQGELTAQLGYEPYKGTGRNSRNSRNGTYKKTVRTLTGDVDVEVPRDGMANMSRRSCGNTRQAATSWKIRSSRCMPKA